MNVSKLKFAVPMYLAAMVIVHAGMFWGSRKLVYEGYSDFTIYYCAGTVLRTGLGHELYNNALQYQTHRRFAPDVIIRSDALPYNHPPFEALLFAGLTYLPYFPAFVIWDSLNLGMLIAIAFLIRSRIPELQSYPWPAWMLASLAFFPIFFTLLQGQDSILLLLLYALAFVSLKDKAEPLAGIWLALGLFKPHLVLPFVFIWLIRSGKRILHGFLPMATGLALLSWAIVGTKTLLSYPAYLWHLEQSTAGGAIRPSDMPNLRGVLYLVAHGRFQPMILTMLLSAGILALAAGIGPKRGKSSPALFCWQFSLAVVTTIFISYHCLGYDLSILFLPIAIVAAELHSRGGLRAWPDGLTVFAAASLFFSPMYLFLLLRGHRLALMGWAVCLLLSGIIARIYLPTRSDGSVQRSSTSIRQQNAREV